MLLERPSAEGGRVEEDSNDKFMGGVSPRCTSRGRDLRKLSHTGANSAENVSGRRRSVSSETAPPSESSLRSNQDEGHAGKSSETDTELSLLYCEDAGEVELTTAFSGPNASERNWNRGELSPTSDLLHWLPSSLISDVTFQAHNSSPIAAADDAATQGASAILNTNRVIESNLPWPDPTMMWRNFATLPATDHFMQNFHRTLHDDTFDTFETNLTAQHFFILWWERYLFQDSHFPPISEQVTQLDSIVNEGPDVVSVEDLDGERCDHQGLNWAKLGASRKDARTIRTGLYTSYRNIPDPLFEESWDQVRSLSRSDKSFRFRRFMTKHKAKISHFQLRNVLAAPTRNSIFYPVSNGVMCVDTTLNHAQRVMDFSKRRPTQARFSPMRVTSLAASDGVLVVGGYEGEYAVKSLFSSADGSFTSGAHADGRKGLINHIHTYLDRRSGLPQAVISSNDSKISVLDCYTNIIVREHGFAWPVNCSATSPDGRLRLVIGDNTEPCITDAESGRIVVSLYRHGDYGFACDWSPNGIHMATGNQDGCVKIWDARRWDQPLFREPIGTELGCARSLHFSPLGGGKPVLVMAEPADIVTLIDATTFETSQQFDFFGEIGGTAFVPDGSSFFVANMDATLGGLLEYERVQLDGCRKRAVMTLDYEDDEGSGLTAEQDAWSSNDSQDDDLW